MKNLLPDLSRPPETLFPERSFADALERLKEVDDGTREMTPEEAKHLWDLIRRDIDQQPVVEASLKGRIELYRKEIERINKFLDWQERYMIRAMRAAEVEEIRGENFRAVVKQSFSYTVLDKPTVEDMVNLPDCVETSLEWSAPKPSAMIVNQILAVFAEVPDDILEVKRRVKALLFAPASFSWAKNPGNGHVVIKNVLKKNPTAITQDRYQVTITDKLKVEGITHGKRKGSKGSTGRAQHRDGADALREVSETDRGSLAPPSDGRSDDADRYHGAAAQPNYC